MNQQTPYTLLNKIKETLGSELNYHDCIVLTSARGVPYLWADKNKLNISVCYFGSTKSFKVWTGCGTPDNKSYSYPKTWAGAFYDIKELLNLETKG